MSKIVLFTVRGVPVDVRMLGVLAGVITIVVFNVSLPKGPTSAQRAFENVVNLDSVDRVGEDLATDEIEVVIRSRVAERPFDWRISSAARGERQLAARTVQLMREAMLQELKELPSNSPPPEIREGQILVYVKKGSLQSEQRVFYAVLSKAKVEQNIQLQNLIKLVELRKGTRH